MRETPAAVAGARPRRRLAHGERRAQLIECAVRVAARKGLGRTAHTAIAEDAGVAVPTVFLYFPTRGELLRAVIGEVERYYLAMARRYHRAGLDPVSAVREHLRGFAESVDTDPHYAQIWLEWTALVRNEEGLWDAFLVFQERVIRTIAASIRKARAEGRIPASVSPPDAARLITASAYTVAQLKLVKRNRRMTERYIEQTLDLILNPRP